ncbi:queuosine salvage family protein [Azospirillum sp.]|uniref:queuosine salvage family protein n=1 Tax=Azospirillum sp. TaxID=34012 RepID=UPI003D74C40D
MSFFNIVRGACARIVRDAQHVRIETDRIAAYAQALAPSFADTPLALDPALHYVEPETDPEGTAAFVLTLDSVNFGSGWFPDIVGPTASGYGAVAGRLARHFREHGPIPADRLAGATPQDALDLFGFDRANPAAVELAELYALALSDLGGFVLDNHDGRFLDLVNAADGSAERLTTILWRMPLFEDSPFYKRAQITAADLALSGITAFTDLGRLTAFADNLLPHVLRHDGVLTCTPELAERIDRGDFLEPGSREETELRAGAVHAVELLSAALDAPAVLIDRVLWHRGQQPDYRAKPRHRTKTAYY